MTAKDRILKKLRLKQKEAAKMGNNTEVFAFGEAIQVVEEEFKPESERYMGTGSEDEMAALMEDFDMINGTKDM